VAIAFADDVCLVAKSPEEAQTLLHHAQFYYIAASATLCAPKSVWTGTETPPSWQIELSFPALSSTEKKRSKDVQKRKEDVTTWQPNVGPGRKAGHLRMVTRWRCPIPMFAKCLKLV
jgi:hypothetical protein